MALGVLGVGAVRGVQSLRRRKQIGWTFEGLSEHVEVGRVVRSHHKVGVDPQIHLYRLGTSGVLTPDEVVFALPRAHHVVHERDLDLVLGLQHATGAFSPQRVGVLLRSASFGRFVGSISFALLNDPGLLGFELEVDLVPGLGAALDHGLFDCLFERADACFWEVGVADIERGWVPRSETGVLGTVTSLDAVGF